MGIYQTKPLRCEAYRWSSSESPDNWPNWLRSAISETTHRLSGKISRSDGQLRVTTNVGTIKVEDGDWIVYWGGSRQDVEVFSPADFDRYFERAALGGDRSEALDKKANEALRDIHIRSRT